VADARSIRVRCHMPLFLNESAARRHFKDVLGNANHLIITILVGLYAVEQRLISECPAELRTAWNPKDPAASANRSRVMMLQMSLVRATDALDMYLSLARRKPALIQDANLQQKMDTCGQSVFGKFAVMRDVCLSENPVISALVEVMIAWRNRQVHSLADSEVSSEAWKILQRNAEWVKNEFRGMQVDRLFSDFSKEAPPSFKEIASFIRATQEAVRLVDSYLLTNLEQEPYLRQLVREFASKSRPNDDPEKARKKQIQSIWGRDASDRAQRVTSFLKNCGLSFSIADGDASAVFSDSLISAVSNMTPSEAKTWLEIGTNS
jgi:hypothetical protein